LRLHFCLELGIKIAEKISESIARGGRGGKNLIPWPEGTIEQLEKKGHALVDNRGHAS